MRRILISVFVLITFTGKGRQSIDSLRRVVNRNIYANSFEKAQDAVLRFLEQKGLSPLETFYAHFFYCDILKASGKLPEAIEHLNDCLAYSKKIPGSNFIYHSLIEGDIAECYFNLQNYQKAREHAMTSISISPDTSLRSSGHAVNYMILGFVDYKAKNYGQALSWYEQTLLNYKRYGETCELPLCYMKMARIYNSMGNITLAEQNIGKALAISDSCHIEQYTLLSKSTLLEIYKENKDYEKALAQLEEINALNERMSKDRQVKAMAEAEVRYKSLLSQGENENLKKVIQVQRRQLFFIIGASVVLCVMVFFLVRVSRKHKKAKIALQVLNNELEEKVRLRTEELARDIIVRKKLERKLNEKILEMETLISKLSHDMRSPLTNVLGLINAADIDPKTSREVYFEKIKEAVKRLDNILIDLTSIMYVTTMKEKAEVVDFKKILNDIKANLAFNDNIEHVEFDISIEQTRDFYSDPRFLNSILQNLVENAVKYNNKPDSVVGIKIAEDKKGVKIQVSDNGSGISPEFHDKIFDMFYRATNLSKGSGLGLYIVKRAVEKLKGKIEVQSEKMVGTTMNVYLPDLKLREKGIVV